MRLRTSQQQQQQQQQLPDQKWKDQIETKCRQDVMLKMRTALKPRFQGSNKELNDKIQHLEHGYFVSCTSDTLYLNNDVILAYVNKFDNEGNQK